MFAVDAVRSGLPARRLGEIWGAVAVVVGAYSVVRSAGDPLDPRGPGLVSTDLSLSLGEYNLAGGVVLVLVGGLLLAAARSGTALLGRAAAVVGLVAALSLYAQIGFTDPFLGGTATSAAFLLSIAVVALAVVGARDRSSPRD
ncbi:hypothetical protein NLX86_27500 [Streptomyces sp. A3M-1-3]|uniref:Rv1678 family membrane protein n=1 Tax=Streptomyces sp. A3M-1-3 TaxID=2962044 RepID=UPI0020B82D78|nr:hypothetical protein [Streptomyces sp. A3M-1-3]MCP3821702.1 hypothetical protein [Streptomyces sp. A3M-1-3]